MDRLFPGMRVAAISGPSFGHVVSVDECCFEIALDTGEPNMRLTQSAIFTVEDRRVTLMCTSTGLARHLCEQNIHAPRASTVQPPG